MFGLTGIINDGFTSANNKDSYENSPFFSFLIHDYQRQWFFISNVFWQHDYFSDIQERILNIC